MFCFLVSYVTYVTYEPKKITPCKVLRNYVLRNNFNFTWDANSGLLGQSPGLDPDRSNHLSVLRVQTFSLFMLRHRTLLFPTHSHLKVHYKKLTRTALNDARKGQDVFR